MRTRITSLALLFVSLLAGQTLPTNYNSSTLAGVYTLGDGEKASTVRLGEVQGVAGDGSGGFYFCETGTHRVRFVGKDGSISTVAGGGQASPTDGAVATSIRLIDPHGIVYDAARGQVIFSDSSWGLVFAIDVAKKTLRTLAGSTQFFDVGDNGPANQAFLFSPLGLALDSNDSLYIADALDNRVRRVNLKTGIITTFAGNGKTGFGGDGGLATAATMNGPSEVAIGADGSVFIFDSANYRVRRVFLNGNIGTFAGDGNYIYISSDFRDYTFFDSTGLAVDPSGRVLMTLEDRVVNLNSDGTFRTYAGTDFRGYNGESGSATAVQLDTPTGISLSGNGLYVADNGNGRIRRVENNQVSTIAGSTRFRGAATPASAAYLNGPEAVILDKDGNYLFADGGNHCVRRIDKATGIISSFAGKCGTAGRSGSGGPATAASLSNPEGLAADADGNVYITSFGRVSRVDSQGNILTLFDYTSVSGLILPTGVAVDSAGKRLFFSDWYGDTIYTISLNFTGTAVPKPVRFAGSGRTGFSGDNGPAMTASFYSPGALVYTAAGDLYIADRDNGRIRKIDKSGTVTTVVGNGKRAATVPGGPAPNTAIDPPHHIALDSGGTLWFTTKTRIWRINKANQVESVAGSGYNNPGYSGDGFTNIEVLMDDARGIIVDAAGVVTYSDLNNQRLRQLSPAKVLVPAKMEITTGDKQSGDVGAPLPIPLAVKVTSATGEPISGVLVNFAITQGSGLLNRGSAPTGADGTASVQFSLGQTAGVAQVTASATGLTSVVFSLTANAPNTTPRPAISAGGIIGVGASTPFVRSLSPRGIVSIFGSNFLPAGTNGRRVDFGTELVAGLLPTNLLGVCVEMGGVRALMLDVFPNQLNVVVPSLTGSTAAVRVITNCDKSNALNSGTETVPVAAVAPEFLYFQNNADGKNPVAAVNAVTGALVGPASLSGFAPAQRGDVLTIYATGFGATQGAAAPGALFPAAGTVTSRVIVELGGVPLDASDILYVGASPGSLIYQLNIRIPATARDGNQSLAISLDGVTSSPNGFVAISVP